MLRFLIVCLFIVSTTLSFASGAITCYVKTPVAFGMVPAISSNITELWAARINRHIRSVSCLDVSFGSGANFSQYIDRARSGDFDVLAVPAHIASYLIKTSGFKPVAFLVWESSYLYAVKNDSSLMAVDDSVLLSLGDIHGLRVALPDPLAEASILAKQALPAKRGDISFDHYDHFGQIVSVLLSNQADIGILLSPFYNAYKKRSGLGLRIIYSAHFPSHGMVIAAPHVGEHVRSEMLRVLTALEENTDLFWESVKPVSEKDINVLHQNQAESVKALKALKNNHE